MRSWALLDGGSLLLLNMRGNRWCSNVGRAHKSNGIFYVVDLQQGWWCQRCVRARCTILLHSVRCIRGGKACPRGGTGEGTGRRAVLLKGQPCSTHSTGAMTPTAAATAPR